MFVKLMSFYFMNSIAVFSVMFSHIFAEKINFCCNFRSVTHTLKLNVSLVSPRVMRRLGLMDSSVSSHILYGLEI